MTISVLQAFPKRGSFIGNHIDPFTGSKPQKETLDDDFSAADFPEKGEFYRESYRSIYGLQTSEGDPYVLVQYYQSAR